MVGSPEQSHNAQTVVQEPGGEKIRENEKKFSTHTPFSEYKFGPTCFPSTQGAFTFLGVEFHFVTIKWESFFSRSEMEPLLRDS